MRRNSEFIEKLKERLKTTSNVEEKSTQASKIKINNKL